MLKIQLPMIEHSFLQIGNFFRPTAVFGERHKEKMERFFKKISRWSTCTKFFMLWKLSEKSIIWVFYLLVVELTFISTQFWNFPISGSWVISDLKNIDFLWNFENFSWKLKVKISKIGLICSLKVQQL
jgi:hypothetical protein